MSGYDGLLKLCRWSMVYIHRNQQSGLYPERRRQYFLQEEGTRPWKFTREMIMMDYNLPAASDAPFDRGHMASPADLLGLASNDKIDALIQRSTYFMHNITPQPKKHNFGPWLVFEEVLRSFSDRADLWIISGPIITGDDPNNGGAFIPSSYFKAIVAVRDNTLYVGAVEIPGDFDFDDPHTNWQDLRRHVKGFPFPEDKKSPSYPTLDLGFNLLPKLDKKKAYYLAGIKDIWDFNFSWDYELQDRWKKVKNRHPDFESVPKIKFKRPTRASTSPAVTGQFHKLPGTTPRYDPSLEPDTPDRPITWKRKGRIQGSTVSSRPSTSSQHDVVKILYDDSHFPTLGGSKKGSADIHISDEVYKEMSKLSIDQLNEEYYEYAKKNPNAPKTRKMFYSPENPPMVQSPQGYRSNSQDSLDGSQSYFSTTFSNSPYSKSGQSSRASSSGSLIHESPPGTPNEWPALRSTRLVRHPSHASMGSSADSSGPPTPSSYYSQKPPPFPSSKGNQRGPPRITPPEPFVPLHDSRNPRLSNHRNPTPNHRNPTPNNGRGKKKSKPTRAQTSPSTLT